MTKQQIAKRIADDIPTLVRTVHEMQEAKRRIRRQRITTAVFCVVWLVVVGSLALRLWRK